MVRNVQSHNKLAVFCQPVLCLTTARNTDFYVKRAQGAALVGVRHHNQFAATPRCHQSLARFEGGIGNADRLKQFQKHLWCKVLRDGVFHVGSILDLAGCHDLPLRLVVDGLPSIMKLPTSSPQPASFVKQEGGTDSSPAFPLLRMAAKHFWRVSSRFSHNYSVQPVARGKSLLMHTWTNLPLKRHDSAVLPKGTIHPQMIELLVQFGSDGVFWRDFSKLPWRSAFHAQRVAMAMRQIARHYGYPLQFTGARTNVQSPDRYRIVPGWKHISGKKTSTSDFS